MSTTSPPNFLYTKATCKEAPLKKSADPVYEPKGTPDATLETVPVAGKTIALVSDIGLKLVGINEISRYTK